MSLEYLDTRDHRGARARTALEDVRRFALVNLILVSDLTIFSVEQCSDGGRAAE